MGRGFMVESYMKTERRKGTKRRREGMCTSDPGPRVLSMRRVPSVTLQEGGGRRCTVPY